MKINTKVNFTKVNLTVLELLTGIMEKNTPESGSKTKKTELESTFYKMAPFTREISWMIKSKDMENTLIKKVKKLKVFGTKENHAEWP